MQVIEVHAEKPYRVWIGRGALAQLDGLLDGAGRVAVVHPEVLTACAQDLAATLEQEGRTVVRVVVPQGEKAKTGEVLLRCWDELAAAGLTRNDVVVGLGGGSTTDLAGFVAASWLRGIGFVQVPTTVLAMVDAAVGGKTGINVAAGKNLVGAFHEPLGVICDLDLLDGLPAEEVRSGLAEVVKCGFIADPDILSLVEGDPGQAQDVTSDRFAELVGRAVQVKADTVSRDLREATSSGDRVGREALNYGHTLAHAIEAHEHFTWRHGEAVAVGMVFVAEVARRTTGLSDEVVGRHRAVLASLGLPTTYGDAPWPELRATMSLDKKARGSALRLVALRDVGRVTIVEAPDEDVLVEAWQSLARP